MDTLTHPWPVYGHDWAVEHLRRSMAHGRVRHAYLITGPDSVGKTTLATAFAMAVNCTHADETARPCGVCRSCRLIASGNHPDMVYSELDAGTGALKIEAVRSVTRALAMKPFEARYRVALLLDFDRAQPRTQDALLKTLEEPPPTALLIVVARSTGSLLPTITSRSQILPLRPVPLAETRAILAARFEAAPDRADLLARLSGGRLGWALDALRDPAVLAGRDEALDLLESLVEMNRARRFAAAESLSKDKQALGFVLELWQTYWRDVLLLIHDRRREPVNIDRQVGLQKLAIRFSADEALDALCATRTLLANLAYNLNLRLAVEAMLLAYPGLARPRS